MLVLEVFSQTAHCQGWSGSTGQEWICCGFYWSIRWWTERTRSAVSSHSLLTGLWSLLVSDQKSGLSWYHFTFMQEENKSIAHIIQTILWTVVLLASAYLSVWSLQPRRPELSSQAAAASHIWWGIAGRPAAWTAELGQVLWRSIMTQWWARG